MTVLDDVRAHAARRPEHPALASDVGAGAVAHVTYAELVRAMDAGAARLRQAGVRPGDRCGLVAPQGARFVEEALAILAAGACLVPIAPDAGAGAAERARAAAKLHHLLDARTAPALRSFDDAAAADGAGDEIFRALRPAYLRFTSGTTHERKGVIVGAGAVAARLAAADRALRIGPDDRILWLLPMAHHFLVSILLYLRAGATILLPRLPLARPVLELGEREGATVLYASPHHFSLLADDRSPARLPHLRLAVSTATGLRAATARAFAARTGVPLRQALGIIEVGLPVVNLARPEEKPESLGQPLPDYDVTIRDEHGQPLGRSTADAPAVGELCIRGPGLFDAYLEPWTLAAELVAARGFRTGDQAWLDADGDLWLAGRRRNRISVAGMKFFAEEVEAVLDLHPAVRASRVEAAPHAQLGDVPVAAVVPRTPERPPAPRELQHHCRAHLPSYKIPRRIEVVASLPLTETGKIRRW